MTTLHLITLNKSYLPPSYPELIGKRDSVTSFLSKRQGNHSIYLQFGRDKDDPSAFQQAPTDSPFPQNGIM